MAKRNSSNPPNHYVLPSDNQELQKFSRRYKIDMMEHVASAIEYAILNNMPLVEVFQFQNSDFVITVFEKDYLPNLDNIYDYYIKAEVYENCPRIVRLRQILKEKSDKTDETKTHRLQ